MKCESWLWVSMWVRLHLCAMNLLYIWLSVCVCYLRAPGSSRWGEKEGELSGNSSNHESFMSICICVCVSCCCVFVFFIACKSPDLPWNKKKVGPQPRGASGVQVLRFGWRVQTWWSSASKLCPHPHEFSAASPQTLLSVFCCWLHCSAFLFRTTNTPKIVNISICWLTASQSINERDKVTIKRLFKVCCWSWRWKLLLTQWITHSTSLFYPNPTTLKQQLVQDVRTTQVCTLGKQNNSPQKRMAPHIN